MQIKDRQKLLVIVAIAIVALFAGDKLVLSPLHSAWKDRAEQIAQLNKQLATGNRLLQRERGLRIRWAEMQQRALTNNASAAEQQLYRAIDRWAQGARVSIAAITPQWKRDADEYMTYECRIDAAGDIGHLSRFLHSAERDPLALKLESVEIGARDKEGQQLSMGLQLSGLVLNPPPR